MITDLTLAELAACCCPDDPIRAAHWLDAIQETLEAYSINTPRRIASFLAQIGHESGGLLYTSEIWGPTAAQRGYEGRADLGNIKPGDGSRFRGHGLIQTTGRANHAAVRERLRVRFPGSGVPDFEADPQALTLAPWAALSAGDYWDMRKINPVADKSPDQTAVTKKINGGTNGLEDRQARYNRAARVLGA